jgi:hypothetical protein
MMRKLLINGSLVLIIAACSFSMGMAWLNFSHTIGAAPFLDISVHLKITVPPCNPGLFQNSLLTGLKQIKR